MRPTGARSAAQRLARVAGMAAKHPHSIPLDTSEAARRRQVEAWIAMGPQQRVRLAASMSDEVRRLAAEGLAARTEPRVGPDTPPR